MSEIIDRQEIIVRAFVLNALRDDAWFLEELIEQGRRREEIMAAGEWAGVIEHEQYGETYWTRPANLSAIWWRKRPAHCYERQSEDGAA